MALNPLLGQVVYVDSNTLIYAVETPQLFPGLQSNFVQPFLRGEIHLVTSWITLAEVLVKPIKTGDTRLESYYRQLISPSQNFTVIALDDDVAQRTAMLRATHGMRTPDAIHIATGQIARCGWFMTSDLQWAKTGIQIVDPATL